jgi:integrase
MARRPDRSRRYFGAVRKLPSGRFQARYLGPDGQQYTARTPQGRPHTFPTRGEASAWLATRQADILRGAWLPPEPEQPPPTFGAYATTWLATRDLAVQTRIHYQHWLSDYLVPTFGATLLADITPDAVRTWHATLGRARVPAARANAYRLLGSICRTAVDDDVLPANPCRIRGAGQAPRTRRVRPATLSELDIIVAETPAAYRMLVLLAAWCALRYGELTELRRRDLDQPNTLIRVRRGVAHPGAGQCVIAGPKTTAGIRDVAIPPHLIPALQAHLDTHARPGPDGLIFPPRYATGCHLKQSSTTVWFYPARAAAGRADLRWHDLRHTGATLAADTGATLAELMARLGHTTPATALIYQHAAAGRDTAIAAALSTIATNHQKDAS